MNTRQKLIFLYGEESMGDKTHYKAALLELTNRYGLARQVFWVSDRVKHKRGKTGAGKKISASAANIFPTSAPAK